MNKLLLILLFACLFCREVVAQIGSTSFAPNVDFTTSTGTPNPARLAAADLNGDGKLDVLVPNNGSSSVSIFRNVSTSTGWYASSFVTQTNITVPANVQGIVLADLDGDGKPDLVTTHGNVGGAGGASTAINIYQNGSSSSAAIQFFTGTAFTTGGNNPVSAAAGDIDGDGKLDLVIGNAGNGTTNTGSIVVLRNTSSGAGSFSFVASAAYTANINTPYDVKIADFDGDGKLDIVASCYITAGYVSVYKNNSTIGSITLNAVNTYTAGTQPGFLSVGDIDGDNKQDILVSNYGNITASLFRNTSTTSISFAAAVNVTTGTNPQGNALSDFDGDGKLDLVVANRTSGSISVFKNTSTIGTFSFAPAVTFSTNNSPMGMVTSDLDGDTKKDIVITNQGAANISVFRNQIIAAKPTVASSNLVFTGITGSSVTLSWTKGNGASRIVLAKASSAVNANPSDSFTYSANANLGSGSQIGTGNYVVYKDTGSSFTVTGLTSGTNYYFSIYEYNGTGPYSTYLTSLTLSGSQIVSANVYYNKSTGALNLLTSWGTNTDGTGTSPTSFSTPGSFYFVQNNSAPSLTASWTIAGTGSLVTFGDGLNAFNLIIPSGYTLTADTISVKSSITFTVQGVLLVNKSYYDNSATAQFIGTSSQTIPPGNYNTLIVTGGAKTLGGTVTVRNILSMSTNITNPSYTFILGSRATSTGTLSRTSGTIIGSFTRWFGTVTTSGSVGLFPMGNATYYRPIEFDYTLAPSTGGTLTAKFIESDPGNVGLPLFDFTISQSIYIDQEGINGYWQVINSGMVGGTYSVLATAAGFTGVTSYPDLRLMRRNGSTSAWTTTGTAVIGSGSNSTPIVSRTGFTTSGGDYGIGSDHTINALPVKIIILTVRQREGEAILNWETASENNSDHFTITRSTDNRNWEEIGNITASGITNDVRKYTYTDRISDLMTRNEKEVYYRLEQVDRDGTRMNSEVVVLDIQNGLNRITLYPLPLNNILTATSTNGTEIKSITILDLRGRELMSSLNGMIDVTQLPVGMYIAKIETVKESFYKKITK